MYIVYADDDKLSLNIVERALIARGHDVHTVYTGDAAQLQDELQASLEKKAPPDFVILDGHNLILDENGKTVVDVQPTLLMDWLRRNGLDGQTRFVLYSNDDLLLQQTHRSTESGFWEVISKVGDQGGLVALVRLIEAATV